MDSIPWAKVHGAMTHFPIALVPLSVGFDAAGLIFRRRPGARDLHAVGFWMLMVGAAACVPAAISGLYLTKGSILGHGALRLHHLFVWPAFGMIVSLATWRALAKGQATALSTLVSLAAVGLILGAGYWGGEMMMAR